MARRIYRITLEYKGIKPREWKYDNYYLEDIEVYVTPVAKGSVETTIKDFSLFMRAYFGAHTVIDRIGRIYVRNDMYERMKADDINISDKYMEKNEEELKLLPQESITAIPGYSVIAGDYGMLAFLTVLTAEYNASAPTSSLVWLLYMVICYVEVDDDGDHDQHFDPTSFIEVDLAQLAMQEPTGSSTDAPPVISEITVKWADDKEDDQIEWDR